MEIVGEHQMVRRQDVIFPRPGRRRAVTKGGKADFSPTIIGFPFIGAFDRLSSHARRMG